MSKRFLIILAVLVLGFVGFIAFQGKKDSNSAGNNSSSAQASEHKIGAGNKGVTLLEYGDFQCTACGAYFPILQQVKEKYGDDITFQFRHFPIVQSHPNAMAAHRAAEAASKQNKFWEMHDMLYERQQVWSESQNISQIMEDYATELALNVEQFKTDYQSAEVNAVINADMDAGKALKVTGTPTFFINGEKVENPGRTLEEFTKTIDDAIAKAQKQ
jgi:protein-disulfide isomerase